MSDEASPSNNQPSTIDTIDTLWYTYSNMDVKQEFLTITDIMKKLSLSRSSVIRILKRGEIVGFKPTERSGWRVSVASYNNYLKERGFTN